MKGRVYSVYSMPGTQDDGCGGLPQDRQDLWMDRQMDDGFILQQLLHALLLQSSFMMKTIITYTNADQLSRNLQSSEEAKFTFSTNILTSSWVGMCGRQKKLPNPY